MSAPANDSFAGWLRPSLVLGLLAAVASLFGLVTERAQFFHSYLFAWLFWSGLSLGALIVLMIPSLTGGKWGSALRNLALAGAATLPWMALLFLPVLLGLHEIYDWTRGLPTAGPGFHHKAQYLNIPFFVIRALVYFAILTGLAVALRRSAEAKGAPPAAALSAGGLIVYLLCMNFASTDWIMSLNSEWTSTIFVELFSTGHFLSALALMTALLGWVAGREIVPGKVFHDLGNLLLALVVFWTYLAFAQFLIIWSGNLPKEISWYLERSRGGWEWFATGLAVLAFFLPVALLLSRTAKCQPRRLAGIAALIVLANALINFWFVAPSFHPDGFALHWLDVAEFVALGALWFALFISFAKRRPLLPLDWMEASKNG